MPRYTTLLLALATLSATALAQNANPSGPANSNSMQSQPAPIERAPSNNYNGPNRAQGPKFLRPVAGVMVRTSQDASVTTISADPNHTELRVEHGIANINVRHPEERAEILVDLPGGQISLLKDGLYTFNANTNTVRVLIGEAAVITSPDSKPIKIKEDHELVFGGSNLRSVDVGFRHARADLIPSRGYTAEAPYGDDYYSYGYYPYYYGYPYGFYGYPYYGYPFGFGVGFGFRGGFHRYR